MRWPQKRKLTGEKAGPKEMAGVQGILGRKTQEKKEVSVMDKKLAAGYKNTEYKNISKVAVVCDGGVGTSAMGAALLRRKLSQEKIMDVKIEAWAADLVPKDVDLLVCQKDYSAHLPQRLKDRQIFLTDSLLDAQAYEILVKELLKNKR